MTARAIHKLTDDEINLLVAGLMHLKELLDEESPASRRKSFGKEKARDRRLLPGLIDKLNHAKNVTVGGKFQCGPYDWRFLISK
jgi:hypothetical protein